MKWKDATVELPAIGEHIILSINGVVQNVTFFLDCGDSEFNSNYYWDYEGSDSGLSISKGQFWMHLPDAPTTDNIERGHDPDGTGLNGPLCAQRPSNSLPAAGPRPPLAANPQQSKPESLTPKCQQCSRKDRLEYCQVCFDFIHFKSA